MPGGYSLVSLQEARQFINARDGDNTDDAELMRFAEAATEVVERHVGEVLVRRTIVETHVVTSGHPALLRTPVVELVSVSVDGTASDVTSLSLNSVTGLLYGLAGSAVVTYVAGVDEVSSAFQEAALIICQHLWSTQRPNAFTSAPAYGSSDVPAVMGMGYALPNRAAELLGARAPNCP